MDDSQTLFTFVLILITSDWVPWNCVLRFFYKICSTL